MSIYSRRSVLLGCATGVLSLAACNKEEKISDHTRHLDTADKLLVQLTSEQIAEYSGELVAYHERFYAGQGLTGIEFKLSSGSTLSDSQTLTNIGVSIDICTPYDVALANSFGSDLRMIGLIYQVESLGVLSNAKAKITKPEDLLHKRINLPEAYHDQFMSFLQLHSIDTDSLTIVVAETTAHHPCDGVVTRQTVNPSKYFGKIPTHFFALRDYGYIPTGQGIVVSADTIRKNSERLSNFLIAEIMGWKKALDDPSLSADYAQETLKKLSSDTSTPTPIQIDKDAFTYQIKKQKDFISTDYTEKHGLLSIPDDVKKVTVDQLNAMGLEGTVKSIFDDSVVNEVLRTNTQLLK